MGLANGTCLSKIGLGWIPPITAAFVIAGVVGSYAIAVQSGVVSALFPFISDSGNYPPESCVLAQFFNLAAAFSVVVYYIRYKLLAEHFDKSGANRHLKRTNIASLLLGFISAFGISLVGNFQYVAVPIVHTIGALSGIGVGIVYCWIDAILSGFTLRKPAVVPKTSFNSPLSTSRCLFIFRLGICVFETVLLIMYKTIDVVSLQKYEGNNQLQWGPSDGGYVEHVISSGSQWATVGLLLAYVLTFTPEFSRVCWKTAILDCRSISSEEDKRLSYHQGNVQPVSFPVPNRTAAMLPPETTCFHHVSGPSASAYCRHGGYVSRYEVVGSQQPWPMLELKPNF